MRFPATSKSSNDPGAVSSARSTTASVSLARWAAWWDAMMVDPADWPRLNEVLLSHCAAVGRNPAEITRSAHVRWSADQSLDEVVDHAHRLFEAGVDVVVFAMGTPFAPSRVETLATRLEAA